MITDEKKSIFSSVWMLALTALLCCALWGSATPAIKIGYKLLSVDTSSVPSIMLFAGLRFTLAGILTVIIFNLTRRKLLLPRSSNIPRVLTLSAFQTVIQYVFFYLGLALTTGVKGTVTSGSTAFFAVIIASLIFKQEKLTLKKIAACIIGFAGIVVINFNGLAPSNDLLDALGVLFVLLSTVSYSFSSALMKRFSAHEDPVILSGYQFIAGGIFLAAAGLVFGGKVALTDLRGILVLFYLACLSAVAYSLWGILLKYNPVSRVSVFNFTTPLFGTLLTVILLPEENGSIAPINLCITLLLVCTGIFLLNFKPKEKPANTDK